MILLGEAAGRWLEPASDRRPRGMVVTVPARAPHRIRRTGGLCISCACGDRAHRTLIDEFGVIDPASPRVLLLDSVPRLLRANPGSLSANATVGVFVIAFGNRCLVLMNGS